MAGKKRVRRQWLDVRNIEGYGKLKTSKDSLELELTDLPEGVAPELGVKVADFLLEQISNRMTQQSVNGTQQSIRSQNDE